MAAIKDRTAAEFKAELHSAIARSRSLLRESRDSPLGNDYELAEDHPADRLTGLELSFETEITETPDSHSEPDATDFSDLSDPELDAILEESATAVDSRISRASSSDSGTSGDPWRLAVAAFLAGVNCSRRFTVGKSADSTKNTRHNASQTSDFAITHGTLVREIMKTGFELAPPTVREAAKGWLTRIVDKKR